MTVLPRRKVGAPKGNQNARKQGFYSKVLPPGQKRRLKSAAEMDGLDQEIALLRTTLLSLLEQESPDVRLVTRTLSTLARLYRTKHIVGKTDRSRQVEEAIRNVLGEFEYPPPGPVMVEGWVPPPDSVSGDTDSSFSGSIPGSQTFEEERNEYYD